MTPAVNWLIALEVFAGLVAILVGLSLARNLWQWRLLHRQRIPLPLRAFMSLRWRGIPVAPVAAAHWVACRLGHEIPLDVWVSFTLLRVDVVKIAAALAAAEKCKIDAGVGQLGAAALAGYDPLDVIRAARDRGLRSLTSEHLNQIGEWGLTRSDDSV